MDASSSDSFCFFVALYDWTCLNQRFQIPAGITLALFGAVQKHSMDQNKVPIRGDIHVIIVGNPYSLPILIHVLHD